ncbi:MAG: family 43 glycosylhydrolase [Eubacteriales bacterium]
MTFQNPILPGFYPDPSICRVEDDFYLVTSTFEYFPAVPIFHSKNLVNWTQIGFCVTEESYLSLENAPNSGGIYAPTLRYHEGVFYMTTTDISGIRNFIVTARDPKGPWSKPILVDFPGIDPSLFFDEDGKIYYMSTSKMVKGKQTTLVAEIDIETGESLSEKKELWQGTGGRFPEAPHIYKKDGWYYVILAEGGTSMGHMVTMARSKNIYGPYESAPRNPIFTHRELIATKIHGTGHMDLVDDQQGNWWAVFLGFRMEEKYFHHLGRETFLAPVQWTEGEFPVINEGNPVELLLDEGKLPLPPENQNFSFYDDFSKETLDLSYQFLRKPSLVPYRLEKGLFLTGNGTTLHQEGTPSFIGIRQKHFACDFSVDFILDKTPTSSVGITVFYNNHRHFDLYFKGNSVFLRKEFDDFNLIAGEVPYQSKTATLTISARNTRYFFYLEEEGKKIELGSGLARHLSTEVGIMSFTGVFLGVFSETQEEIQIKALRYE